MNNLLYYPYINIPRNDWVIRTLLYYHQIGSIVPLNYFYYPEKYDKFMRELVLNELVIPINPFNVLEKPWEVSRPFIDYIKSEEFNIELRRDLFRNSLICRDPKYKHKYNGIRIHVDKFESEIFYQLEQAGLAKNENYEWYIVENKTASELMTFLATVIGCKLDFLPATDLLIQKKPFTNSSNIVYKTKRRENIRREVILKELIPFPEQIDLSKLRKFKDKNSDLLDNFKNKVELIALDHNIEEDSQLFAEKLKELNYYKEELCSKMSVFNFGQLFFGTVCGITGAIIGLSSEGVRGELGASIAALPTFFNAVHSALKSQRIEKIPDQNGMKYLALIDKKLRIDVPK